MAEEGEAGRYVCDICGRSFDSEVSLVRHRAWHTRKKEEKEEEEGVAQSPHATPETTERTDASTAAEAEGEVIKPPEVVTIENAIAFLEQRLPKVHGIEKYSKLIVESLRENPAPLRDPNTLYSFIKSIAPRAYDSHLRIFVIDPLYAQYPNLPQAVDTIMANYRPPQYMWPPTPQPQPAYIPPPYPPYYTSYYPYMPPPVYSMPSYAYNPYTFTPPRPHKTYKIVVDGVEIETDEAGLLAWKRYEAERRKHEIEMEKLKMEIERSRKTEEEKVPVRIGDREVLVPASLAPLYIMLDRDREIARIERDYNEKLIKKLEDDIRELKSRPGLLQELQYIEAVAQRMGMMRGGRTTIDVLESMGERIERIAQSLLQKIPSPAEWKPEITRTPEERAMKAEEIEMALEKTEEILKAEEELIRAAARIRGGAGGKEAAATT
jgi:hypothetical protein